MTTFNLLLVTPKGKIFNDKIVSLEAPGEEGCFGVLAHHTPFVAKLKKGILRIKGDSSHTFEIGSGVLEVNDENEVLVLADEAQPATS